MSIAAVVHGVQQVVGVDVDRHVAVAAERDVARELRVQLVRARPDDDVARRVAERARRAESRTRAVLKNCVDRRIGELDRLRRCSRRAACRRCRARRRTRTSSSAPSAACPTASVRFVDIDQSPTIGASQPPLVEPVAVPAPRQLARSRCRSPGGADRSSTAPTRRRDSDRPARRSRCRRSPSCCRATSTACSDTLPETPCVCRFCSRSDTPFMCDEPSDDCHVNDWTSGDAQPVGPAIGRAQHVEMRRRACRCRSRRRSTSGTDRGCSRPFHWWISPSW